MSLAAQSPSFAHTSARIHLAAFLLFVVVTLVFTYPLPARLNTHFAGDNIDVWLNMWANWWTEKALTERLPFYHTTDIFYPVGVPLYFHSFSHTNTALWLLLAPLIGPLAAYNAATLAGFVLLGFGVYLLAGELTGSAEAGLVAGLAATFAPYHVWECVHPTLFSTQYIPLLLWSLARLLARPTAWRGLLVAACAALNALTGWHQLIYAAVLTVPYLAWQLFLLLRRRKWSPALTRSLLVAVGGTLALVGGAALPLLREQSRAGYAEAQIAWVFNTDALALVTPSFLHPLWGTAVRSVYDRFPAPNRPAFVGYAVLTLAALGLAHLRKRDLWLAGATPLALLLALGTALYVDGRVIVAHLPWYDPLIGFIRAPVRLNLVLGLCLALLAGFGVARLLRRRTARQRLVLTAGLSALVLFEFAAWPFPTTRSYVPPFYDRLAQEAGRFAIVEDPLDRQTDKFYMYWQTVHGKPLVNGHISRPPATAFDFIRGNAITAA
ncbi:MAG TPA: hypothetical protein ENK17_05460, partial [Anaerolineae bacterium]|nr:hypothetical protein [Anaerolineae bacterium]